MTMPDEDCALSEAHDRGFAAGLREAIGLIRERYPNLYAAPAAAATVADTPEEEALDAILVEAMRPDVAALAEEKRRAAAAPEAEPLSKEATFDLLVKIASKAKWGYQFVGEGAERGYRHALEDIRALVHAPAPSAPAAEPLKEVERLAAQLIGRFPAACEGRHHHGQTCDYCLVDDILRVAREGHPPAAPAGEAERLRKALEFIAAHGWEEEDLAEYCRQALGAAREEAP